jgi:hypothetical protein
LSSEHVGKTTKRIRSGRDRSEKKAPYTKLARIQAGGETLTQYEAIAAEISEVLNIEPVKGARGDRTIMVDISAKLVHDWTTIVSQVKRAGTVVVVDDGRVEMVAMDANIYRRLLAVRPPRPRTEVENKLNEGALKSLTAAFNRRLDKLNTPEMDARSDQVFRARGNARNRPKAGTSY